MSLQSKRYRWAVFDWEKTPWLWRDPARYHLICCDREAQLETLLDHRQLTERSRGRLVLVRGEAGIGKTSLTGEFLRQVSAEEDILTLRGHRFDADPAAPYGPVLDALLQLVRLEGAEHVAECRL